MVQLIETHRERLSEICRARAVRRLEVFGSVVTNEFDPQSSDLDFLVEFGDLGGRSRFSNYFELKRELESLFDRRVDLVEPGGIRNPYFQQQVDANRVIVYAS